jgi:hypothetical protein
VVAGSLVLEEFAARFAEAILDVMNVFNAQNRGLIMVREGRESLQRF